MSDNANFAQLAAAQVNRELETMINEMGETLISVHGRLAAEKNTTVQLRALLSESQKKQAALQANIDGRTKVTTPEEWETTRQELLDVLDEAGAEKTEEGEWIFPIYDAEGDVIDRLPLDEWKATRIGCARQIETLKQYQDINNIIALGGPERALLEVIQQALEHLNAGRETHATSVLVGAVRAAKRGESEDDEA